MSGMKRAADAAPRFQERLKTQITRSTAVLLTAFLLLFGVLLAIYSEGYTYYENREYNRQLTEAFRDTYLSCADYLRSGDNMAVMESFLTGEITELNMSYQFHRFSYSSHRVSDLLLLNGDGAAAFSTMAEPSSHLLYFCQSVIPRLTERTDVYTTIYYMTAGGSRLLFARQLDGLGYAFLLLDGSEWNRSMGRLPYDYVVTDTGGTVMVASNAEMVDDLNRFTGAGKTRFTRDGQQYMVSAGQPAVGGLVVYTLLQRGHWGTYYIIGCLCAVLMFGVLFFTLLRVSREIASRNSRSVETLHDELSIIQQGNVDHKIRLDTGDEFQEIAAHALADRRYALIENGTWSPASGKKMDALLSPLKGWSAVEPVLTVKSALRPDQAAQMQRLADAIAADVKAEQTEEDATGEGKHRYVCKVCGYVYEGDELPADYKCPLCGAGPEYFRQEA